MPLHQTPQVKIVHDLLIMVFIFVCLDPTLFSATSHPLQCSSFTFLLASILYAVDFHRLHLYILFLLCLCCYFFVSLLLPFSQTSSSLALLSILFFYLIFPLTVGLLLLFATLLFLQFLLLPYSLPNHP